MGIAPADQAEVFEPFGQAGDTLADSPRGTGLGLPICREIVEHHGGRLWLESPPSAKAPPSPFTPARGRQMRPSRRHPHPPTADIGIRPSTERSAVTQPA